MVDLRLAACPYKLAKFACQNWHYTKSVPAGKAIYWGVWENSKFIGVVIFSRGANKNIAKPYGLMQTEVCELTRVALADHQLPVTKIVSVAIRLLKKTNPGLRLIVSYADQDQGHEGVIYKAGNWLYAGEAGDKRNGKFCKVNIQLAGGEIIHKRTASAKYGTSAASKIPGAKYVYGLPYHKFLYPLDKAMAKFIADQHAAKVGDSQDH